MESKNIQLNMLNKNIFLPKASLTKRILAQRLKDRIKLKSNNNLID